ncbi:MULTISPECIES: hypothetical protein [Rhizobium]|uniref:Uncharacterized protein n=1 Tax=Rhizobium binae TaxID=1138190 RepID=A0ABV2MP05_9HYPH|nr:MULTISPECIES: hypothetical protein [Rhizobium]NKL49599.1 hypothetical protein [Rhizobium leguminosarum bv. viciae]MBX4937059.1 hypothetical protein [Rhizobium binae]MBX4943709.1 hypothetical protein [Rhizobium binae]MBX4979153.1 hypothetical protein [Rhizobium binae]MBX4995890.1 hypothetical protein [Rhizobium binae]
MTAVFHKLSYLIRDVITSQRIEEFPSARKGSTLAVGERVPAAANFLMGLTQVSCAGSSRFAEFCRSAENILLRRSNT